MLKIKSNWGLPLSYFLEGLDNANNSVREDKKIVQFEEGFDFMPSLSDIFGRSCSLQEFAW